jgi:hypothetical protein
MLPYTTESELGNVLSYFHVILVNRRTGIMQVLCLFAFNFFSLSVRLQLTHTHTLSLSLWISVQEEKIAWEVKQVLRFMYMTNVGRSMTVSGDRNADFIKQKTIEQGVIMADPASKSRIPDFIAYHNLNMDEVSEGRAAGLFRRTCLSLSLSLCLPSTLLTRHYF